MRQFLNTSARYILIFCLAFHPPVHAAWWATEGTQIINHFQLAASYVQQAQQTVTQIQQYTTMLQNLQRFGPQALLNTAAKKLWNDQNMDSSFKSLFSLVQGGTKLAYSMSSLSNQLKTLQPPHFEGGMNLQFDYAGAYKNWATSSRDSVDGALKVIGAQAENLNSEQEMMEQLQEQAQTAEGQMQALKAGADIGIAQVNQLQMLRQLMLAQHQALNMSQKATEARQNSADDAVYRLGSKKIWNEKGK